MIVLEIAGGIALAYGVFAALYLLFHGVMWWIYER